tara:strand:- start:45 stop:572 length:528 start_codon:yes stop_codon:yes gene_type:complete
MGRQEAEERRIEMAEFIAQMRAAEAAEEEEEYWRVHTWERYKRDAKAWWRRVGKPDDRVSNQARLATEAAEAAAQRRKFDAMESKLAANFNEYDDEVRTCGGGGMVVVVVGIFVDAFFLFFSFSLFSLFFPELGATRRDGTLIAYYIVRVSRMIDRIKIKQNTESIKMLYLLCNV